MLKRISVLILIMAAIISLSGCWKEKQNKTQEGSHFTYEETEIGKHSGLIRPKGSRVNSRDQLVIYDQGQEGEAGFVTINHDGQPVSGGRINFAADVHAFTLDQQDNIYVLTAQAEAGGSISQKITVLTPRGSIVKTIELGTFSSAGDNPRVVRGYTDLAVDKDGNIYLTNPEKGLQILKGDGTPIRMLDGRGYTSLDLDAEGNIITLNMSGKRVIEKLSAATGEKIWSITLDASRPGVFTSVGTEK